MKRIGIRYLFGISVGVIMLIALAGCSGKTTPPGASFVYGQVNVPEGFGGSYTALRWNEGLTILLLDDIAAGHENSGSGSTASPIWRGQGSAVAADGRQLSWRVETTDGKTASFFIDGQVYDLAQGTLFLIRTRGGRTNVLQQKRDLAGRCADSEDCQLWLKSDATTAQFIQEVIGSHLDQPNANPTRIIDPGPNMAKASFDRGLALYGEGRVDQAIAEYTRAIELQPEWPEPYNARGNAHSQQGNFEEAISDYTKTIMLAPQSSTACTGRCRANYQQGKLDQAIADCSRAIELDPKAVEAYLHRGLALRDKGQKPEAVQDFESFLQLSDNPMDRMQVERLMNKIR